MNKVKIIGELGINCNGDINLAKELIKMSKDVGLDYVKLQKRTVDIVYSVEELYKPRESPWGTTTRDQKLGLEFEKEEYDEIDRYCSELGMKWFASPWDVVATDFICNYDIPYIKIPSAYVTHSALLNYIKEKNKPVILSIGMSEKGEVDKALEILGDTCQVIMHTTSSYPTPLQDLNLLKVKTLQQEYGKKYEIGYSNHSESVMAVIYAAVLGASWLEVHITKSRSMYGSDQAASIEKRGLEVIVDWTKDIPDAFGDGYWKIFDSEMPVMQKLRKWS